MARLRGLTYAATVTVDVVHDIYRGEEHAERRVYRETRLGQLPAMVGSCCCHTQHTASPLEDRLDQGGYFVVSGIEKVVVAQEKLHHNVPYVFANKQPSRYAYQCEIRSCNERKLRSTSSLSLYITNTRKGATPQMVATLPFVTTQLSVLALFRLLGVATREEAVALAVGGDDAPEAALLAAIFDNDPTADLTMTALHEHVALEGTREASVERRQRYLDHIINCEVLPHQGLTGDPATVRAKALFLGLMVRKLVRVYRGELPLDDRDHAGVKRVECSGIQFGLLFRQVYRSVHKSLAVQLYRAGEARKLAHTNVGEPSRARAHAGPGTPWPRATGACSRGVGGASAGTAASQNSVAQRWCA